MEYQLIRRKYRIKPKPYIEAAVLALVPTFTKLCGLPQNPLVVFNRRQVREIGYRYYKRLRSMGQNHYGTAYPKANIIWVTPNHESVEDARDTLAHEFVHFRFPYLAHGEKFSGYIKQLMKGKSLGTYRPRKKPSPQETALVT